MYAKETSGEIHKKLLLVIRTGVGRVGGRLLFYTPLYPHKFF